METINKKEVYKISLSNSLINIRSDAYDNVCRYQWEVDRHCNAEYEVHIVLHGNCNIEIDNDSFILDEGKIVIIEPGRFHSANKVSSNFERFCFSFSITNGDLLDHFSKDNVTNYIKDINSNIFNLCTQYFNEYEGNKLFSYNARLNNISSIFIEILRTYNINDGATIINAGSHNYIDIMDEFFDKLTTYGAKEETLANELGMSKRQLNRELNKLYCLSFREKLIVTKIEQAKWLLVNSNNSIQQIGEILGYSSKTAFYNMFVHRVGVSPKKYRLQNNRK